MMAAWARVATFAISLVGLVLYSPHVRMVLSAVGIVVSVCVRPGVGARRVSFAVGISRTAIHSHVCLLAGVAPVVFFPPVPCVRPFLLVCRRGVSSPHLRLVMLA